MAGVAPAQELLRPEPFAIDPADWAAWWDYNQERFLEQRATLIGGARRVRDGERQWRTPLQVHDVQVLDDILPALKRALDAAGDRDWQVTAATLFAMAKIGAQPPEGFRLVDVLRAGLRSERQEVRETAALSLGVAGRVRFGDQHDEQIDLLCGLVRDDEIGRAVSRGAAVDLRTRAFAAYGAGLLAGGTEDVHARRRLFAALRDVLADERQPHRDVMIAAITGIGGLRCEGGDAAQDALLAEAADVLWDAFAGSGAPADEVARAHCPTAMARLLGKEHPRAEQFRQRFVRRLTDDAEAAGQGHVARSCVLALGRMARPRVDATSPDARVSEALFDVFRGSRDEATRCAAALAMGEIGGLRNRTSLLEALPAARGAAKAWCALALGIVAFAEDRAPGRDPDLVLRRRDIGVALFAELGATDDASLQGALAIALGMSRHVDAAPRLRELLAERRHDEGLAGHLCAALGMMNAHSAVESLREIVKEPETKLELRVAAAFALARLGDLGLTEALWRCMPDERYNLAGAWLVLGALGKHGDAAAVPSLLDILRDRDRTQSVRSFAAAALGDLARRDLLSPASRLVSGMNLGATVPTLTDQLSSLRGVLDQL